MNDIAKQRISERVIEALNKEGLSKNESGPMLGIHPSYLSLVVNPEKLNKCPNVSWDILQKWINSGLSITKYAEKNGVLVEKKPKEVTGGEKKELVVKIEKPQSEEKFSVNLAEIGLIFGLASNGKSVEQISKELHIYNKIVEKLLPTPTKIEKSAIEFSIPNPLVNQKCILDVEINILLNGQRIKIG
jgi:hypothetical protein